GVGAGVDGGAAGGGGGCGGAAVDRAGVLVARPRQPRGPGGRLDLRALVDVGVGLVREEEEENPAAQCEGRLLVLLRRLPVLLLAVGHRAARLAVALLLVLRPLSRGLVRAGALERARADVGRRGLG